MLAVDMKRDFVLCGSVNIFKRVINDVGAEVKDNGKK